MAELRGPLGPRPDAPEPQVVPARCRTQAQGQGRCFGPPAGLFQRAWEEAASGGRAPTQERKDVPGDSRDGEQSGPEGERKGACRDPSLRTCLSGSGSPVTCTPPILSQLTAAGPLWAARAGGWKGYCLLAGFGDHQVLHHLPLQGQSLGGRRE